MTAVLLTLGGCASSRPVPGLDREPAASERPGFAVYTRAERGGSYQTHLLFADAGTHRAAAGPPGPIPPVTIDGLWVLDPRRDHLGVAGVSGCTCPAECGPAEAIAWREAELVHGTDLACEDPAFRALTGGTLFGVAEAHTDVCATGLNLYSSYGVEVALAPTPYRPPPLDTPPSHRYCQTGAFMATGQLDVTGDVCEQHFGVWQVDDAEQCELCTRRVDWSSEVPYVLGANLIVARDAWDGMGGGSHEVVAFPLAAAACPSPEDPCGDASAFSHIPEIGAALTPDTDSFEQLDELLQGFWIAPQGQHALVLHAEAGPAKGAAVMSWQLWERGRERPLILPAPPTTGPDSEAVLGVRYHADLGRLLERSCAMGCAPIPDDGPSLCDASLALEHVCPEVEVDESCFGDAEAPVHDEPGPPPPDPHPPASTDLRGSRELGNACFVELQGGLLDSAERLCRLALARADNDRSRGALHFNLGLIAERRGDRATARRAYETSLRLRPGNATVQRHLDALP